VANATVVLKMCYLAKRAVFFIFLFTPPITLLDAAEFFCPSGDVTCLIAAINQANGISGEHVISLEPGSYTLQAIDNGGPFIGNGLPVISGSIKIESTAEDIPTVIERDVNAPRFRIFEVSAFGILILNGLTVQRGLHIPGAAAILNRGVTSLENSIVRDSDTGFNGAIHNLGTLRVIRSIIADNFGGHQGGGILNSGRGDFMGSTADGNVLVENSTIARNGSADGGGIFNYGSLIVKNSAIIDNHSDCCQPGGGILNLGGSVEIVNSTIAKNSAGGALGDGGGGLFNSGGGQVSITNSTIRENETFEGGGGIENDGGTVRLQNTIVAGNTVGSGGSVRSDCIGTITSLGNNFIGDPADCDINLQPSDLTGDPGLGTLVEFGEDDAPGKVFYPVLAGSVVINRANSAACPKQDQLGNPRVGTCDIGAIEFQGRMLVSVDVRPRRDANRINPNSSQNINVAVFSAKGFDATTLDPNTVRFGGTGTEAAPINNARRDVDGDGRQDLVARFRIQELGIQCGDTSATLTGQTSSGFAIVGSSPIRTTGCKEPKEHVASRGH
jgi:hypothetical protein